MSNREFFSDLPDTTTPIRASRLNGLLNGEEAMGTIIVDDISGKNLFNKGIAGLELGGYTAAGVKYSSTTRIRNINAFTLNSGTYTISCSNATMIAINKVGGGAEETANASSLTFTLSASQECILTIETTDLLNASIQLEIGSEQTEYAPYNQPIKDKGGYVKEDTTFYANDFKCRNLLGATSSIPNKTSYEVTFTNNGDGTITANGTASGGNAAINIYTNNLNLKAGTYVLSGCPNGGSSEKYYIATNILGASVYDYGEGVVINAPSDVTNKSIWINVVNGQSVSNLVFKPQLEIGSEVTPFTPYAAIANEDIGEGWIDKTSEIVINDNNIGTSRTKLFVNEDLRLAMLQVHYAANISNGTVGTPIEYPLKYKPRFVESDRLWFIMAASNGGANTARASLKYDSSKTFIDILCISTSVSSPYGTIIYIY